MVSATAGATGSQKVVNPACQSDFRSASKSPRLRLRPIRLSDAFHIRRLGSDEAVNIPANLGLLKRPGARRFINARLQAWADQSAYTFAILVGGAFVGSCTLHSLCLQTGSAEIGCWIGQPHWGQGLATRAVKRLVAYARHNFSLSKLIARTLDTNFRSESVLRKCGFRYRYAYIHQDQGRTVRIRCFSLEA
jgi:RimJ/RimL family protein N-acetyltransferase